MRHFASLLYAETHAASLYTLSTFITQLGSFLLVPLFWRKLSPADYGVIAITDILTAFLAALLGLSLESSITRFYYEWPELERRRRIGTIWIADWTSILLLGGLALGIMSVLSQHIFPQVGFFPFLFLGIVHTILNGLPSISVTVLRMRQRPALYAAYSVLSFLVHVGFSIYFVLVLDKGLFGYYTGLIVADGIMVLAAAGLMLPVAHPCLERRMLKEALSFSLPLIPADIAAIAAQIVDRLLLQRFASLESLGIYSISVKFASVVISLHSSLKLSFVPFMVKAISQNNSEGIDLVARMRIFYVLPILGTAVVISTFVDDFVQLSAQPAYFLVSRYVPWLLGPAVMLALSAYMAPGLFLAKRTDKAWIPTAAQLCAVVLAGIVLIPQYQVVGVIISRFCSVSAFAIVCLLLSEKYYPIPLRCHQFIPLLGVTIGTAVITQAIHSPIALLTVLYKTGIVALYGVACCLIMSGYLRPGLISYSGRKWGAF